MKRLMLFFVTVFFLVSLACQKSVSPPPERMSSLQTAVPIAPQVGNAAQAVGLDGISAESAASGTMNTIYDFIVQYPELYGLIIKDSEATVLARVLTASGPVLIVAALNEPIPVIGQADDAVIIIAIVAAGSIVYVSQELLDQYVGLSLLSWGATPIEDGFSAFGVALSVDASKGWTTYDPGQFNLPDPNGDGRCKLVSLVTGKPCIWQVRGTVDSEGNSILEIVLRSGDEIVGHFQSLRVNLTSLDELASALVNGQYQGSSYGWITHIKVAEWVKLSGLGRLMWEAGDRTMQVISTSFYAEKAVHIFADAAGWGSKLLKGIDVTPLTETLFLYVIK